MKNPSLVNSVIQQLGKAFSSFRPQIGLNHLPLIAVCTTLMWVLIGSLTSAFADGGSTSLSIMDLATKYEEGLTRPLIPEFSLWLPFWLQVVVSALGLVALFFTMTLLRRHPIWVMGLTVILSTRYMLWRTFETLDFLTAQSAIVGYIVYGAEVLAFVTLLLGYFQMVGQTDRKSEPLSEWQGPLPSVDVYLCTYNEPLNVVYRSLVGCNAIDYQNKTVYLLDDGARPEMADLASKLGVKYISRENNDHAKAGNMNNAMKYTTGEYVVIFDADHVPCRTFLNEVVGFFKNDKLAYVQTPQHFYTPDPFQRNLVSEDVMNNEQDLFFHVIEPGNDYWDAAFFAGSGAIFRRTALDDIEGFATQTITEDVHTGLRLHANGWKSVYYNKDLSAGMAQDSFSDFVTQRIRWGRGMAQILFFDNPWLVKGLSLAQRICYFSGIWYFFFGFSRIIFMLAPLAFLFFNIKPINAGIVEIVTFFLPAFLASMFGYTIISRGLRHSFWSEVYETATCVYMFQTNVLTLLFPWHAKFKVTPKEGLNEGLSFNWLIVFPQIVLGFLVAFGLGFAVIRTLSDPSAYGGILTNVFWSIYNLALIIGAVYVAQERPQFRLSPRIYRQVRCEVRLLDDTVAVGYTTNVSESGVAVVFDQPIPVSGTLSLKILDWDLDELSVFQVQAVRSSRDESGRFYVGFRVVNRTDEQHQQLVRHMFGDARVWSKYHNRTSTSDSLFKWVSTPFRMANTKEQASRRRTLRVRQNVSCELRVNGESFSGVSDQISETGIAVVLDNPNQRVDIGQVVDVAVDWEANSNGGKAHGANQLKAEVMRHIPMQGGGVMLGLNFVNLTKDDRVAIIRHLYQETDDLVRVAPVVAMQVGCQLNSPSTGTVVHGVTQEISEMGAVIRLRDSQTDVRLSDEITVDFEWAGGSKSEFNAIVKDIAESATGQPELVLVYFKDMDLRTLDQLSRCLHMPAA